MDEPIRELADLGVTAFINKRSSMEHSFTNAIQKAIKSSTQRNALRQQQHSSASLEEVKRVLAEEIEKYAPIKEKTISIPSEGNYELIKPLIGYKRDIEKKIARFPFEKNVFLMMKFRSSNRDLGEFIIESLKRHGLNGVRADLDDWNITRNVYNPIAVLYCCKFGIALFDEPEDLQAYSPNVAYELGMMHYQSKDCLILKHSSLPQVPFDLIKDLYDTYDKELQVRALVEKWITQVA